MTRFLAVLLILAGCGGSTSSETPILTLAAVGDTHGYNIPLDSDPLGDVRDLLAHHDVFLFNHEGVLIRADPPPATCAPRVRQSLFLSRPEAADFFRCAPVTVATLANNHILDCGEAGLVQTVEELRGRGIATVGAGPDLAACEPLRLRVHDVSVAVVSYLAMPGGPAAGDAAPGAATWAACDGRNEVAALAAAGDFVVVVFHLHLAPGWTSAPAPPHIALIEEALTAGAHLVLAHGPHVPQGVLTRPGGVALLSLGNFLFRPDYIMPEIAHRSVIAEVRVFADRLDVSFTPVRLDRDGRPTRPAPDDAATILDDLTGLEIRDGKARVTVPR